MRDHSKCFCLWFDRWLTKTFLGNSFLECKLKFKFQFSFICFFLKNFTDSHEAAVVPHKLLFEASSASLAPRPRKDIYCVYIFLPHAVAEEKWAHWESCVGGRRGTQSSNNHFFLFIFEKIHQIYTPCFIIGHWQDGCESFLFSLTGGDRPSSCSEVSSHGKTKLSWQLLVKWHIQIKNNIELVRYDSHTREDIYQQARVSLKRFLFDLYLDSTKTAGPMCNLLHLSHSIQITLLGRNKYTQTHSPRLGPDSGADICEALVSFQNVVWCVAETLPPTKVGSSHPEAKQWLMPRRGVTSARSRLVEETRRVKQWDPTEEHFREALLCFVLIAFISCSLSLPTSLWNWLPWIS